MTGDRPSAHEAHFYYIAEGVSALEPVTKRTSSQLAPNVILWIGGLYDTPGYVSYPFRLVERVPANWAVIVTTLSSSGYSWGTTTLDRDVTELSKIVNYFRSRRVGKIVLMGHSTGTQDTIHYLCSPETSATHDDKSPSPRPRVDGGILQAPVSDREACVSFVDAHLLNKVNAMARDWVANGRADDCLPTSLIHKVFPRIGLTARRWLSLLSPDKKGQDDYFSSDLDDETLQQSFGRIPRGTRMLFLCGEKDPSVPSSIDVPAMTRRWKHFAEAAGVVVHPLSTELVPGASHNLNDDPPEVVEGLCDRVVTFLSSFDDESTAAVLLRGRMATLPRRGISKV